jgi:hypothetical protein
MITPCPGLCNVANEGQKLSERHVGNALAFESASHLIRNLLRVQKMNVFRQCLFRMCCILCRMSLEVRDRFWHSKK